MRVQEEPERGRDLLHAEISVGVVTPSRYPMTRFLAVALTALAVAPAALAQRPAPRVAPRLSVPAFEWGRTADRAAPRRAPSRTVDAGGGAYRSDPSPGSAPDGYTWFDSNEAALALTGGFDSIVDSGQGDNLDLSDDDAALVTLPFPFGFEFYGTAYSQLAVHTNGIVSFTSTAAVPDGQLGDSSEPNSVVAAFWTDLVATNQGGVYTASTFDGGREVFVVEWHEMALSGVPGSDPLTFQMRLYEDGEIRLVYPFTFSPGISGPTGTDQVGIESDDASDVLDIGAALANSSISRIPQGYTIVIQPPVSGGFGISPRSLDGNPVDMAYVTTACGSQPSRVQEFVVRTFASSVSASLSDDGGGAFVVLDPTVAVVGGETIVRVALVGQPGGEGVHSGMLTIAGEDIPLFGRVIGSTPEAYTETGGGYVVRTSVPGCGGDAAAPAAMLPFGPAAGDVGLSISDTAPAEIALATPFRLYGEPYSSVLVNSTGSLTFEEAATPYRLLLDLPPDDGSETAVVAPAVYGYFPSNGGGQSTPVRGAAYGGVRDVTGDGIEDLVVTFYRVPVVFGGYATWQAVLSPSATPGANGTVRYTYFAGPDPAGGEPYTVLQDRPDGLSTRSVAGVSGDQAALATESRARAFLSYGIQPPMFDVILGTVATELVPRTETVVGAPAGPFRAGYRLLSAPAAGMTVAMLAEQNLVQGLPDSYPTAGNGSPVLPNLLTSYDGVAGYAAPAGLTAGLVPGEGFFWQFYDLDILPTLDPGNSQSVRLPVALVTGGTRQATAATVPLTAAATPGDPTRWEMVGNPFEAPISTAGLMAWGTGGTLDSGVGQVWKPEARTYVPTTVRGDRLEPWEGMFIEGGSATALVIPTSAQISDIGQTAQAPRALVAFSLTGAAPDGTPTQDDGAVLVVGGAAEAGWDAQDASKLAAAAPFATLAFAGTRDGAARLKSQESRSAAEPFTVPMTVDAVGVTGALVLRWAGVDMLPADWALRLTDAVTGETVDLRQADHYAFSVVAGEAPEGAALSATGVPTPRLARGGAERFALTVVPGSAVGTEDAALPEALALALAGPNPFRSETRLRVALPAAAHVAVTVVDALGRQVARLADGEMAAGEHTVAWDAGRLAAGVYVVRMQAGRDVRTVRVVVAR